MSSRSTGATSQPLSIGVLPIILIGLVVSLVGVIFNLKFACGAGMIIIGMVGCWYLYLILFNPVQNFSLCRMLAASTMISYFLASGISLCVADPELLALANISGELDLPSALVAMIYIMAYCILLHLLGEGERRHWVEIVERAKDRPFNPSVALSVIATVALLQLYAIHIGEWGYGGYQLNVDDDSGQLPGFVALVSFFSAPMLGVVGWSAGRSRLRPDAASAVLLAVVLVELLWTIGQGRRYIVFQALILVVMFFLGRGRSQTFITIVKMVTAAAMICAPLWLLFFSMRITNPTIQANTETPNEIVHLQNALETASSESSVIDDMGANIKTRLYIIGYLASLIARVDIADPALGLGVLGDIIEAFPRPLFPGKEEFKHTYGRVEDLVNPRFNLEAGDEANSLVTASLGDFLWAGVIIYPLIVYGVVMIAIAMIKAMKHPTMAAYGLSYMILTYVQVEAALTDYVLPLRVLLILMLVWFLYDIMPGRHGSSLRSISQSRTANQTERNRP